MPDEIGLPATLPLLKWPGGKRRVLPALLPYVPPTSTGYVEPFFGGGALFFNLQPTHGIIADINAELINVYQTVKTDPEALIVALITLQEMNNPEDFARIRAEDRAEDFAVKSPVHRAARTLYLNRTCFNGLYRVNSKNHFNTPFGSYQNPRILDAGNIRAVSRLFNDHDIDIRHAGYDEVLPALTGTGKFIYLDPPYVPLSPTASFVGYTKDGFGMAQQETLRDMAETLDAAGHNVLISNSDTPITRDLYTNFTIVPIKVTRSVGAQAATRVAVGEVLAVGKTLAKTLNL